MSRTVAILGAGKIGESLLAGLLSSDWRTSDEIVVTGRREERVRELEGRYGVRGTLSNADAVRGAALVVIAVKPQDFEGLLGENGGLGIGPRLLRTARGSDGRCRHPARPQPRDVDTARRPDDVRDGEAFARREDPSRRAARGGHVAGWYDDSGDPRAGAGRRARRVP